MEKARRSSLATVIYDCAQEVHRTLGSGILPSIFKTCLAHEMRLRGIRFRSNMPVSVYYKGIKLPEQLTAGFIIEEDIVVEILENPGDIIYAQKKIQSLLLFTGCSLGIIIDPSADQMIDGWKKITLKNKKT
ncbi:MAG: GxxExxY protein [Bacteroidales bacterium]|nr:GxxExxY protein [Bacteroidales bacterium]